MPPYWLLYVTFTFEKEGNIFFEFGWQIYGPKQNYIGLVLIIILHVPISLKNSKTLV